MVRTQDVIRLSLVTVATALSLAVMPAQAQSDSPMINQGAKELSLTGLVSMPEFLDEVDYTINVKYGYFVKDGWEIGFNLAGTDFGGADIFEIGAFTEYNFNRSGKVVPYIGLSAAMLTVDYGTNVGTSTTLNDDSVTVGVNAGLKWFVRPYMAIRTGWEFQVASDDVFNTGEDSFKDNVHNINIGMAFYF